jgi:long-chain acyl-CoA synthetase
MKGATTALMRRLAYPEGWIREADEYSEEDSYVAFDPEWADEIPDVPEATLDVLLRRHRVERPTTPAVSYLGRTLTYGDLDELVGRAARVLRDHGVGRGDVVAVMVPTSAIHWVVFFALARLGAVHCGVNVMYRADELAYQLSDVRACALVCLDALLPIVERLSSDVRPAIVFSVALRDLADPAFNPYASLREWWETPPEHGRPAVPLLAAMQAADPIREGVEVDARSEPGQIVYTAGTTGRPKGALQTHFNLIHNALTHTLTLPTRRTPVTYSVSPMFHTGGFFVYSLPAFARGGLVVPRPLFDPADALCCVADHGVNALFGPPTFFAALLNHGLADTDLSSLEVCSTGAAPVPADLPARWEAATGLVLRAGWGMTELNGVGTYNGLPGRLSPGTLGVPVAGEIRIVTDDGEVAPREQEGEIEYRGMQLSKGYLGKPAETKSAFRADGWFRTGDIGRIDVDGLLHYVDRRKDLIVTSGYNIAPAEIEATLLSHPLIVDAAVVGAPHRYRGEVPVAYVVGQVSATEVVMFCRDKLSAIKVPGRVEVVEQLPKNAMGKTLRRALRDIEGGR